MGYKPKEYYNLTYSECTTAMAGYFKRRSREFEHTRAICWTIAAVNRDPKKKMPEVTKWWPLPTDEKVERDVEGIKEKLKRIDEIMKQRYAR